jgi:hypothetical protein
MSNNSVEKYMDIIKRSMTMTNVVEKNKILDEAHKVLSNSTPNTGYIDTSSYFQAHRITPCCSDKSNNSVRYQTNVYCGPGNAITPTGNPFGPTFGPNFS